MIIIKIFGGLGNQLFQYALGRQLAILNKTSLYLDISDYQISGLRQYELNKFNIKAKIIYKNKILKQDLFHKILYRVYNKFSSLYYRCHYIEEKYPYYFDSNVLNIQNNSYLNGYWQTEKYFIDIKPYLLKEIVLNKTLDLKNLQILNQIKNDNSVSVHFRRTDYISKKSVAQNHGICPLDYYYQSLGYVSKNIKHPVFYVFSDDTEWVKQNFKSKFKTYYLNHNQGEKSFLDLYLMSKCKHNIIANSSFSWWGAWLNQNQGKLIIAPKRWSIKGHGSNDDLVPKSWIRI
jgi:hypothetical protein